MKKIYILITFILIVVTISFTHAQPFRYAPLELGNIWVYEVYDGTLRRAEIVDTAIIIDSIKYFGYGIAYKPYVSGFVRLREDSFYVSNEDSTFPQPWNEYKYYKKKAQLGDSWIVNLITYTITDTFPAYTFDTLVTGKMLNENLGLVEWDYVWTEEFGQLNQLNWLGEVQYYLKGCVIDGRVYGDTTFTVSSVDDNKTLMSFELFQNYPNPFNPKTIIRYSVSDLSYVTIKVYDILGNTIKTLVSEDKPTGSYEVGFDATGLLSGTYFYRITADNPSAGSGPGFIETKKMLLIK
jgi:hypothetical protein